jgi:hypothetical protein
MPDGDEQITSGGEAGGRKKARKPVDLGRRSLWASAGLCFVGAGVFYLLESYLETNTLVGAHVAQHISIALLVGAISILGIEYNAKRRAERELDRFLNEFNRYREQVAKDVFDAVLGRVVDQSVVGEIKHVLRMPFIKKGCQYTIRFLEPDGGMSSDYCILRRDLFFKVRNVSADTVDFPIRSSYTADEDLTSAAWKGRAFHLQLIVNKQEIPVTDYLEDQFNLSYTLSLNPQEEAEIFLRGEEPMRIEASRSYYYQSTPMDGVEVIIENNYSRAIGEVEVQVHHPGWPQVRHDANRNRYTLDRAFLPGQGFEVIWKKADPRTGKASETPIRQLALLGKSQSASDA